MAIHWTRYHATGRLPWLAALIIRSWLIGSLIGTLTAALFVVADIGNIGTLLRATAEPWIAFGLFAMGFSTMIGSLYAASAIMWLPRHDDAGDAWRHHQI